MEASGSSDVYQEAPSPVEASSPEFFELCSEGEESEGGADAVAAGSKRQRRPSTSYGEAGNELFMTCSNGEKLLHLHAQCVANRTSNRRLCSAQSEAVGVDYTLYTPQVFLMQPRHLCKSSTFLLPLMVAAPKKKSKLATKNRIAQSTPITLKW